MLEEQLNFIDSMKKEYCLSLGWYTSEEYKEFNKKMRKEGKMIYNSDQLTHMNNITEIFEGIPSLKDPITVWRGMSADYKYNSNMFTSTSIDVGVARRFTYKNCCLYKITVSPGSKVIPVWPCSYMMDEREVLLDMGGIMLVTSEYIGKSGIKVITCTYSPGSSQVVENDEDIKRAEAKMDPELIVKRILKFFEDDDPQMVDADDIRLFYKDLTKRDPTLPKELPSEYITSALKALSMIKGSDDEDDDEDD